MPQAFLAYFVSPAAALLAVAAMVFMDWLVPYRSHKRQLDEKQRQIDNLEAAVKAHELRADDAQRQLVHILSAVKSAAGTTVETT